MTAFRHALVLGGAGFLGAHVVEALVTGGTPATVLDVRAPEPGSPAGQARLVLGPVARETVASALQDTRADLVVHLAGSSFVPPSIDDPRGDLERNAGTTLEVLEAVRRAAEPPLVVYASSAAVYGNGRRMPMDEEHPHEPQSPYGVGKLAAEHYVAQYVRLHGLRALSVRPFSLYGPWQRKQVVHDLVLRALGGEDPLQVAAPADVSRDYVFGADAGAALVRLAGHAPAQGEAYNLATGTGTTLQELATRITAACGGHGEPAFTGRLRPGDPLHWTGDPARAAALGARCATPLDEGIAATVAWLRG